MEIGKPVPEDTIPKLSNYAPIWDAVVDLGQEDSLPVEFDSTEDAIKFCANGPVLKNRGLRVNRRGAKVYISWRKA